MRNTTTLKINFTGGSGYELDARLEMPATTPKAFAIFCHCFTCTKDTITTFRISRALAEQGYAVLRFDFTGLGNSKGEFSQSNFTTNVADIMAAVDYLRAHHQPPSLLMGHSLGGTAAIEAAIQVDEVMAAVTVASPSQPDHVLHHFGAALTMLEQGIPASIDVAGEHYDIEPQFIEDLHKYQMQQRFSHMNKPTLIFSVIDDALVKGSNAVELAQWINAETTLIELKNSDHLLSAKQDTEFVASEIDRWFSEMMFEK